MHMPLLHMNSTDLQGWWEAADTERHREGVTAGTSVAALQAGLCLLSAFAVMSLPAFYGDLSQDRVACVGSQDQVYFCSRLTEIRVQMWVLIIATVSSTQ